METLSDEEISFDLRKLLQKSVGLEFLPKLKTPIVVTRWQTNKYQNGAYSYRSPRLMS